MNGNNLVKISEVCKRLKPFVLDKKKASSDKMALTNIYIHGCYAYASNGAVVVQMDLGFESEETLLLAPNLSESGNPADYPNVERLIERANGVEATSITITGDFSNEWKRIFTYASTIAKGPAKQTWIAIKGSKLYAFAGNDTVQSCFVLGDSGQECTARVTNCLGAGLLYNIANLLNDMQSTECTLRIPDQLGSDEPSYGLTTLTSSGVKIVLAAVNSNAVVADSDNECTKVLELMENVFKEIGTDTEKVTSDEVDELEFLE